jgi:hypothetical protein
MSSTARLDIEEEILLFLLGINPWISIPQATGIPNLLLSHQAVYYYFMYVSENRERAHVFQ